MRSREWARTILLSGACAMSSTQRVIIPQQARAQFIIQSWEETASAAKESAPAVTPPPAQPVTPAVTANAEALTRSQLRAELDEKVKRVRAFLGERGYDAIVLNQPRNVTWLTAGIADNQLILGSEKGAWSLVVTKDGKKLVVADAADLPRLASEDLNGLGYEARELPWTESNLAAAVRKLFGGERLASDTAMDGAYVVDIAAMRSPLTDTEIIKLRWLAHNAAEAVIDVIDGLSPGVTERTIEARTSDALLRRKIRPAMLLVSTDERVRHYQHAPPSDFATLDSYGMISVFAKRWGLSAAVTRAVYFGTPSAEMQRKVSAAARINAVVQGRIKPGQTAGDLFGMLTRAYAEAGFPDEWQRHHQGGAIGYAEREWLATPQGTQRVGDRQAFAWNPMVQGAVVQDTVLVTASGAENLTLTEGWPFIATVIDGKTVRSPGILVKQAATAHR